MKLKIVSKNAPKAIGPYSQATVGNNLIFTSGQIHNTIEGKLLEGTIEEQTHQVMKNLQAVLNEANADFSGVVQTTIYLTDMAAFNKVNAVYATYFEEPFPARATVSVRELPLGANIEISMVAMQG